MFSNSAVPLPSEDILQPFTSDAKSEVSNLPLECITKLFEDIVSLAIVQPAIVLPSSPNFTRVSDEPVPVPSNIFIPNKSVAVLSDISPILTKTPRPSDCTPLALITSNLAVLESIPKEVVSNLNVSVDITTSLPLINAADAVTLPCALTTKSLADIKLFCVPFTVGGPVAEPLR